MVETADPGVVQLTCCKSYPCTGMCTTFSTVYVDNCVSMGSVASQSFRVMKTAPIPTSSCQSGSACNGVAMQSRCTGPGGSQVVYCLPDCPEGTNRAQIECLDGPDGGAECACGPGDLLCPEKSFCSTSSSFNSVSHMMCEQSFCVFVYSGYRWSNLKQVLVVGGKPCEW
jgi:hypothetical protein